MVRSAANRASRTWASLHRSPRPPSDGCALLRTVPTGCDLNEIASSGKCASLRNNNEQRPAENGCAASVYGSSASAVVAPRAKLFPIARSLIVRGPAARRSAARWCADPAQLASPGGREPPARAGDRGRPHDGRRPTVHALYQHQRARRLRGSHSAAMTGEEFRPVAKCPRTINLVVPGRRVYVGARAGRHKPPTGNSTSPNRSAACRSHVELSSACRLHIVGPTRAAGEAVRRAGREVDMTSRITILRAHPRGPARARRDTDPHRSPRSGRPYRGRIADYEVTTQRVPAPAGTPAGI